MIHTRRTHLQQQSPLLVFCWLFTGFKSGNHLNFQTRSSPSVQTAPSTALTQQPRRVYESIHINFQSPVGGSPLALLTGKFGRQSIHFFPCSPDTDRYARGGSFVASKALSDAVEQVESVSVPYFFFLHTPQPVDPHPTASINHHLAMAALHILRSDPFRDWEPLGLSGLTMIVLKSDCPSFSIASFPDRHRGRHAFCCTISSTRLMQRRLCNWLEQIRYCSRNYLRQLTDLSGSDSSQRLDVTRWMDADIPWPFLF